MSSQRKANNMGLYPQCMRRQGVPGSIESVIQKARQYIIVFDIALEEEKKRYPVFQLENITAN